MIGQYGGDAHLMPQYCLWDSWAIHWKWKGGRKPHVLYRDWVDDSLVQGVERGWLRREKLQFRHRHDQPPIPEPKEPEPESVLCAKTNATALGTVAFMRPCRMFHGRLPMANATGNGCGRPRGKEAPIAAGRCGSRAGNSRLSPDRVKTKHILR